MGKFQNASLVAFPDEDIVQVVVNGCPVEQLVRSRTTTVEGNLEGLGPKRFTLRLFQPGNAVLAALLHDALDRARAGDTSARVQIATLRVEPYLPQPTFRRLSPVALERAGAVEAVPGAAGVALDAAVKKELPRTEALEDELMFALVGKTCADAGALLTEVRRARRIILKRIPPLHDAGSARYRDDGGEYEPDGLSPADERLRKNIRQELRRCVPGDRSLLRLTTLHLRSAHQSLVDEANRLTLAAMSAQLGLSDAERRAYKFFRLKRTRPTGSIKGLWFDGIVADHPFLDGLIGMCPSVFYRLVATSFFRSWPSDLQPRAELDLRRHLQALLRSGWKFLRFVREEDKQKRRNKASDHPPFKAQMQRAAREHDAADLLRGRRYLTKKQQRVVLLRNQGLTTEQIAKELGVTRQAVEKHLASAAERVKLRRQH